MESVSIRRSESLAAASNEKTRRETRGSFLFAEANPWLQPAFSSTTWTKRPILARGHPAPQQNISQGLPALPLFSPQTPRFRPRATLPSRGGGPPSLKEFKALRGYFFPQTPGRSPPAEGFADFGPKRKQSKRGTSRVFNPFPGAGRNPRGRFPQTLPPGGERGPVCGLPGAPRKGGRAAPSAPPVPVSPRGSRRSRPPQRPAPKSANDRGRRAPPRRLVQVP